MRRLALSFAFSLLMAGGAFAQTNLRIGLAEDPDVLDPTLARTYVGRIVFASLCDKLFDIDENLKIVPQLALSHETSADGKTVIIKLRPNVKFHDGEPFDAAAAKFSLDRHLTLTGSVRKPELSSLESVDVVDPLTIKLNLKAPFSPLMAQLTDRAGMMMAPKATAEAGDKFGLHPVCAGPYKFVERVPQDRIVVEKFADYWDKDHVFIDKITYQPIVDGTVRLANLRSGSLDLIERVLATDIKTVRDDPKLKLSKAVSLGYLGLMENVGNGPKADTPFGKDARVRQALELSLDRDAINQAVFNGEFVPGNQWVSPQNFYYQKAFPIPKRDVAKAKTLLQQAGVKPPVTLDFLVPNGPENRAVAEVVQSMAAEAGFDLKIRVTEFTTSIKETENGNFQLSLFGWSGRADPDGNAFIIQTCKAGLNYGKYCDKAVDALHDQARAATDPAERKKIYEKIAAKVLPEGDFIYLYHPQVLIAHSDKLEGYRPMPDGLVRVIGLKLK
ncbi:MAG TPA: ABC transporter substrate-binding protein [Reyranella sp.]|nr:ABC transporter substrate-binding protein [Reyranella sp.]